MCSNEGLIYEFMKKIASNADTDPLECGLMWNLGLEEGSERRAKVKRAIQEFYFKEGFNVEGLYQVRRLKLYVCRHCLL